MSLVDRASGDQVDLMVEGWARERPDLDLTPMALVERVGRLAHVLGRRVQAVSRRYGLDAGLFEVLLALRHAGHPYTLSPTDLARWLLLSPGALTNRLYRLETDGLIRRIPDPGDRRSLLVALTADGLDRVEESIAAYLDTTRRISDSLDAEQLEHLSELLRKMLCDHEGSLPAGQRPADADVEPGAGGATEPGAAGGAGADPRPGDGAHRRRIAAVPARAPALPVEACWWPESRSELARLQRRLARRVREVEPWEPPPDKDVAIGAVFASLHPGTRSGGRVAWAAAVVMDKHHVVATATATRTFPEAYQPGYYALTTGPILQDVVLALSHRPDVLIVNRAGRDHIRGAGLAVQLGAALDMPTIGITEHPFAAEGGQPDVKPLSWSPLRSSDGVVGFRVRTTAPGQPITVHAGWRTDAETAREVVCRSTNGMRIPEPLRRARDLAIWLRPESRPS